jgi:hypothetical protein
VATAITPIAFFETVMVNSYETLVDSNTKVDVNTGMVAAGRLQSLNDSRDYSHDLLVMRVQMDQICDAVKSTVTQEMWGAIIEKLEELEEQHPEALDVGTDSFDDADDDAYDPPSSSTRTTSFDLRSATVTEGDGTAAGVDGAFAVAWTTTYSPTGELLDNHARVAAGVTLVPFDAGASHRRASCHGSGSSRVVRLVMLRCCRRVDAVLVGLTRFGFSPRP